MNIMIMAVSNKNELIKIDESNNRITGEYSMAE